ncbi:MAG TPA: gamma carbonic anhydrase family protein [Geminicoccus sp.]|uniref:gamma carbonic anhydrase family protein n=1 Tax=Geminicoccus sp. TaxID=2024832 RepID=UPI002C68BCC4|nr:gamma carbonic anhydrase family protein [Geminicoccus sp.]HWL66982.1 gamma carbonic anhydrase family protein [Geminicoccus sp.]
MEAFDMLYALGDDTPQVHPEAWVAPSAVLIGKVVVEKGASVWFGAVLRGDNEPITVGEGSNVQENCVLHTDPGYPLTIGRDVTVGHLAMLHGCTIGDGALIGMCAVVLNGAVVGAGTLVGAKALVGEHKQMPEGSLILGAPGKPVRTLTEADRARMRKGARFYVERSAEFRRQLRPLG